MAARIWPVDAVSSAPMATGRYLRQTTVSPFVAQSTSVRPLGGLSGVRPGTPTSIVTATSTLWTVTPFLGLIDGEALAIAGTYEYAFDTNQTGSVVAAGGSARTDRLDVQVSDPAESDGSAVPSIQIIYTQGTPALAAAPPRSHPLAQINVPASSGGSPTVTWSATYYAAPGGYVPFNTYGGLQLWTTAMLGQHATVINDVPANNGDYIFTGSTWVGAAGASQLIVPTSVAGSGVSMSPLGKITIAGAASASLNGVFGSQYDNYLLMTNLTFSISSLLQVNLRAAGVDSGTANYNYQAVQGAGSTAGAGGIIGQTAFFFSNTPGGQVDCEVKLYGPSLPVATRYSSEFYGLAGGTQNVGIIGGSNGLTSVFDGLTLKPSGGGTMTGNVRVYGFSNG